MENFMRILAVVSYKGTHYQGWSKQPNGITIQETIENALSQIYSRPISIYGAGRTDAGVHALGQTFHFDLSEDMVDLDRLIYSLNCILPDDIKIEDMEEVEEDFHARFSATGKVYHYAIMLTAKDVFFHDVMYLYPYQFNEDLFKEALTHFIGEHNFKNFTSKVEDAEGFVRDIFDIETNISEGIVNVTLYGNGFMRYMIRFIIGAALEVAKGKMSVEQIDELLDDNSERNIVSCKAPACGLTLVRVNYENL